jgi:RNA polymerase sigma-70 factor (ECF subfamily)
MFYREMVERAQLGEPEAIDKLAKLLRSYILKKVVALRLPDDEDFEGVTDDIIIKILNSLKRFQWRCDFLAWITKIIRNEIASLYVRRSRRKYLRLEPIGDAIFELADQSQSNETEGKELDTLLQQVLLFLRQRHYCWYQVFVLWWYGEMSYDEIAKYLRIPLNTVKSRLWYAKSELRRICISMGIRPD